jgi:hypothetical protein
VGYRREEADEALGDFHADDYRQGQMKNAED